MAQQYLSEKGDATFPEPTAAWQKTNSSWFRQSSGRRTAVLLVPAFVSLAVIVALSSSTNAATYVTNAVSPYISIPRVSWSPPTYEAWWQWGNLTFPTAQGERDRWQAMLHGLYGIDNDAMIEPWCPVEWFVVRGNNALASFRDLALAHANPFDDVPRDNQLRAMGVQVVALTVRGEETRQERLRKALRKEGITDFLWQVGWDVADLPEQADFIRPIVAAETVEGTLTSPLVSLTMKHLVTMSDWAENDVHSGSYYQQGALTANKTDQPSLRLSNSNEQSKYLLVIEDDSVFVPNFVDRLRETIASLPTEMSMATLGACCNAHEHDRNAEEGVHPPHESNIPPFRFLFPAEQKALLRDPPETRCTGAYIINLETARILNKLWPTVATTNDFIDPLDQIMNKMFRGLANGFMQPMYWVEPPLAYQSTKAMYDDHGRVQSSLREMNFADAAVARR